MFNLGLQFALVRTYAIPSISKLLRQTDQLHNKERNEVGKRYADTAVILYEIYHTLPGSARSSTAFGRLNYLHGHYIKQGKISNDDMLYVLALFMNSPPEWIARHDWRPLYELELAAYGLFHRFMGEAQSIDFSALDAYPPAPLPGHAPDPTRTWRTDGLAFYTSLDAWCKAYEEATMVPHPDNHAVSLKTLDLLASIYPTALRPILHNAFISLMDDRMRLACQFPAPPPIYAQTFSNILAIKAFATKHLSLPARALWGWWVPRDHRGMVTEATHGKDNNRRYFTEWEALPHYVQPSIWNRWFTPGAWFALAMGNPRPGDQGMEPDGWAMPEVGPAVFKGRGAKEAEAERDRLQGHVEVGSAGGGCPFFVKV
jgi:hypothetical protein